MSLTLAHLRICLSNCMDVSEGRKALHHRQARSIHERKLISLSLRAGCWSESMSLALAHLRICLSNCMYVSEGRKALHHRQARSIHERKLLSLSLRAGFHKHTHPHAHRLAQAHEQSPL